MKNKDNSNRWRWVRGDWLAIDFGPWIKWFFIWFSAVIIIGAYSAFLIKGNNLREERDRENNTRYHRMIEKMDREIESLKLINKMVGNGSMDCVCKPGTE